MIRWLSLWMLMIGLAGCSTSGTAVQYYLVDPVDQIPVLEQSSLSVQVVDLHLPQYLERFQIASRRDGNRLVFSNGHQWGENLRKNLTRTFAVNLASLLGTVDVGTPANRSSTAPTYRVQLYIISFERNPDNRLQLAVRWQITNPQNEPLATLSAELSSERELTTYADTVGAMATLFGELSRNVAQSIADLEQGS